MLLSCILASFYYHVYLTVSCYDVYLASLAKWLSVCLRTKWLSVRIAFLSLKYPGTQIATKYYKYCGIQRQLGRRTDYPDMEKFGNKDNTIRIQRNASFTSGNMKEKYNKGNPWIELSNKTVWKKKCIKWFLKYFHAFFPSPISEKGKDETSRKFGKGTTDLKKKKKSYQNGGGKKK